MKKLSTLFIITIFSLSTYGQESNICETTPVILEKLYCTYCENEGESNVSTEVTKATYQRFDFEGKKAINIILFLDGTVETPNYIANIIIPEVSLKSGKLESEIIDEWGNGLDTDNSVIIRFIYRVGKSSIAQWSNWGGHNRGESEGTVKLEMLEDGSICGSFKSKVFEDGSSLRKEKHSIISASSFLATAQN
jgi:hypothetical protein